MDSRSNILSIPAMAQAAKQSLSTLAAASGKARQTALNRMAEKLLEVKAELFDANAEDLVAAPGLSPSFQKRLQVTEKIFDYMLNRLREAAALPDPVGRVLEGRTMPSGLQVSRIAVPIGVIAIIYEARPNVTTDASAVALKSGNAVILKGGSESIRTNRVLARAMREALTEAGLPADAVQLIERTDHDAVRELLQQDKYVDLVIPRGGKQLIRAVSEGTRIPVLKHYDGICHQYVAADADVAMAVSVIVNSKCQRVEVCNALETLLVDADGAPRLLPPIAAALQERGVELRGCEETRQIVPECLPATETDWDTEYLAPILSIKVVHGIEEAIAHIAKHGSGHTDGIITGSLELAQRFIRAVDSASVLVNASTRLSGGGDYGMGAVVGISTDRLHARGPVGPAELCTYKWIAIGNGTLRE
ncbi:MAG: glutamate-5-semialdehyde dehydrogenase [Victivallales bacterium]|nr:glutamate-5-semialdehyde dehydrogenase [Victivallales bacterium]